jgi:hypothetical protein
MSTLVDQLDFHLAFRLQFSPGLQFIYTITSDRLKYTCQISELVFRDCKAQNDISFPLCTPETRKEETAVNNRQHRDLET